MHAFEADLPTAKSLVPNWAHDGSAERVVARGPVDVLDRLFHLLERERMHRCTLQSLLFQWLSGREEALNLGFRPVRELVDLELEPAVRISVVGRNKLQRGFEVLESGRDLIGASVLVPLLQIREVFLQQSRLGDFGLQLRK